jgi:hypothetical protein|tara:strand:- start:3022 stop:3483 length:462 start_codon:yes stop_codon:yes gene_type:complete
MSVSHTFGVITPARRKVVWDTIGISLREDSLASEAFDANGNLLVLFVLERDKPQQLEQFHNDRVAECLNAEVLGPVYEWIHGELRWSKTVNRGLSGCRDTHYVFPTGQDISRDFFASIGMTTIIRQTSKGIFVEEYELLKENNTLLLENQTEG